MRQLLNFKFMFWKMSLLFAAGILVSGSFNAFCQPVTTVDITHLFNRVTLKTGNIMVASVPACFSMAEPAKSMNSSDNTGIEDTGWLLKFIAPGKVFKDVSFADTQVGYIVTELGSVYKSTDGGESWISVMNLGFPYYWYGVHALTPDTVVIAGFNNQASISTGIVRWTLDGGATWSQDINLVLPVNAVGWLERVHFFNQDTGIVINSFSGGCWYTTNGGKDVASWTYEPINPDLAWFAGNIDAQPSGRVFATGIHLAQSIDFGASWVSGPCADNVFDGGVDFLNDNNFFGWTGGGQISNPVSGWVHRTTDAGLSWSPRLNTFDYPIRAVRFLDETRGWAIGGNVYGEAGGIYSTNDGGLTWNLDVNTEAEMFSMEIKPVSADSLDVWCVGSTGGSTGYKGKLYKTRIASNITGIKPDPFVQKEGFSLDQNMPNPFGRVTAIGLTIPEECFVTLKVYDMMGHEVATLIRTTMMPGHHSIVFDGSNLREGIYWYRLQAGTYSETKKFVLRK